MSVVRLDDYRSTTTGDAVCLVCGHKWVAVVPAGVADLECPECGTFRGVFNGLCAPDYVWECNCGCQHFYLHASGAMCAKCGLDW